MWRVTLDRPRVLTLIGSALFTLLVLYVYPKQIVPILEIPANLHYFPLQWYEDVLYFALALLPALWLPTDVKKPSHFVWWMLFLTVSIPTCVVMPRELPSRMEVLPFVVAVDLGLLMLLPFSNLKPMRLPRLSLHPAVFWLLAALFTIATFAALLAAYGVPQSIPGFGDISALRAAFKEKTQEVPAIVGYMFRWQGSVTNPLFIAYGMVYRRPTLVILGSLGEVGLFLITSLRSYNMSPLILIAVGFWLLYSKRQTAITYLYAFTGATGLLSMWLYVNPYSALALLFFDRFLLVGGQLSALYYEFFTQNPLNMMGFSFITNWLFKSPYDIDIAKVIGREYFISGSSSTTTIASAHIWADAFGNFGWFGVLLTTFVTGGVLWVIDSAFTRVDRRIGILLVVMISLAVNGEGIHTSILTGGILPLVFVGLVGARALKPREDRPQKSVQEVPA